MNRLTELESLDISGTNLGGSDGDRVVTGGEVCDIPGLVERVKLMRKDWNLKIKRKILSTLLTGMMTHKIDHQAEAVAWQPGGRGEAGEENH